MLLEEFNWKQEVLESAEPVLVDFWAKWCEPCQAMNPIIHKIAEQWKVCKVNLDTNRDLARHCRISVVPTLLIYKGGQEVFRRHGAAPESVLLTELERLR